MIHSPDFLADGVDVVAWVVVTGCWVGSSFSSLSSAESVNSSKSSSPSEPPRSPLALKQQKTTISELF